MDNFVIFLIYPLSSQVHRWGDFALISPRILSKSKLPEKARLTAECSLLLVPRKPPFRETQSKIPWQITLPHHQLYLPACSNKQASFLGPPLMPGENPPLPIVTRAGHKHICNPLGPFGRQDPLLMSLARGTERRVVPDPM